MTDFANPMFVTAFPSGRLELGRVMSFVQDSLRESGIDVESAETVTNLPYDGSETVSIRSLDNREGIGAAEISWEVWLMSPDRGMFIGITFIYEGGGASESVPMMSEIVRRIRWE